MHTCSICGCACALYACHCHLVQIDLDIHVICYMFVASIQLQMLDICVVSACTFFVSITMWVGRQTICKLHWHSNNSIPLLRDDMWFQWAVENRLHIRAIWYPFQLNPNVEVLSKPLGNSNYMDWLNVLLYMVVSVTHHTTSYFPDDICCG